MRIKMSKMFQKRKKKKKKENQMQMRSGAFQIWTDSACMF